MDKKEALMATAQIWADCSKANRTKVGCVIAKDGRILATGYNGTLPGNSNICEINDVTKEEVVHAEQNAILFCAKNGISTNDCEIYVTTSPCATCAKMIIMSGIKRVFYKEKYRCREGLDLLIINDIHVSQM